MVIERRFLTLNPYSRPGIILSRHEKIAIHYVGNPGSSALANRNYFESLKNSRKTYASSHYIIGLAGEIIQCVPEDEIAYCTNQANDYSISIECCHPDNTGIFTQATRKSLIALCADLCERYGLDPINDIIRHYDVTGKACPRAWVEDEQDYNKFKREVLAKMEKRYQTVNELPVWARDAIQELIGTKAIADGSALDMSDDMLRTLVIVKRYIDWKM